MVRVFVVFLGIFFLSVPVFATSPEDVPRITVEELKTKLDRSEDVIVLDVRGALSNKKFPVKITGALRKPFIDIYKGEELFLDKGKEIVIYCS